MPKLKMDDYLLKMFTASDGVLENVPDNEKFNKFVVKEVVPYIKNELDDVFGDEVKKVEARAVATPAEEAEFTELYVEGNFLLKQLVEIQLEDQTEYLELGVFSSMDDFKERLHEVVAQLFD